MKVCIQRVQMLESVKVSVLAANIKTFQFNQCSQSTFCTFLPDRRSLVWNADTGQCLATYVGHSGSVNSVRFPAPSRSADGSSRGLMLTSSGDCTAHLWPLSVEPSCDSTQHQVIRLHVGWTGVLFTSLEYSFTCCSNKWRCIQNGHREYRPRSLCKI